MIKINLNQFKQRRIDPVMAARDITKEVVIGPPPYEKKRLEKERKKHLPLIVERDSIKEKAKKKRKRQSS